jgi:hypothetical protein
MLGIERPSTRMVSMANRDIAQRLLIHSPSPQTVLKKEKKTSYPFHSLLSTIAHCGCHSVPSQTLPLCLAAAACPSGAARSPPSRALLACWSWWSSLCLSCAPLTRLSQDQCWWRWCTRCWCWCTWPSQTWC